MRFVVIDGLDASGKDTQAEIIKEMYESMGEKVILRSHPCSDNIYGAKAREALWRDGKRRRLEASTYYAMDVIHSVRNYYGKADTLIFVRYLCGAAYLPYPLAKSMYHGFSALLPSTDYKFFIDVDPEVAIDRINGRPRKQMFENIRSLRKVRNRVLRLVDDWHIIDGSRPQDDVTEQICQIIDKLDRY